MSVDQPRTVPAAGRKKGGGRAPTEAADSLRSTQIAEVAILVSEGEAQGLVTGLKSLYLDGVAVENADGSRNFQNVEFAYTVGTQGQAALPGLNAVQTEFGVGVQIDQAAPITRTISDATVDQVRVTIGVPQLTESDTTTGDLKGSSFEFAIEVQSNGGGFVEKHRATVSGKTTSRYTRAVRIDLAGGTPYDIRVRRISADPASTAVVNRFSWDSYTAIKSVKLRYPNSAVAYLRVNAQNFSRVPTLGFDWLGQRVKVPVNYDPITRVYTGAWDGTFKLAWTNNPAWVFYDALTHERYGLGAFVAPAMANKWVLYQIGQYSDAMVADGRGGQEPRFTCNAYIQTRAEAYNLLRDLAAVFRGMVFWAGGAVDFAQDAPGEAELLFTPANVVDGDFSYADTSERQQHSVFIVQWNDLSQFGKQVSEVYTDPELVTRYGMREITLQGFGCTSRGQAARIARWAAFSEQFEGEMVSFAVGADGVAALPGRLFKVADPNESGERLGGRIKTATSGLVTLDAPVTLAGGESYTLSVLQPDAADATNLVAEKRTVVTAAGTTEAVAVSPAFSAAPAPHTVWLLESNAVQATWWRCLSVEEVAAKNQWRISGVKHHPGKYALVEQGLKLDPRPISRLTLHPPKPASVSITETPYLTGNVTRSRVTVSWPEPGRGLTYLVSWRHAGGGWVDMPATSANSTDVDALTRGTFEVSVRSQNPLGNGSRPTTAVLLLLGKTELPPNPAGFTLTLVQGAVLAAWAPVADDDYLVSEIRVGASWAAGAVLFEGAASKFNWAWPALGTWTLWIKHFDTSLNASAAAASAAVAVTEAVYTQWGDVRGANRPSDNATNDITLIGRGVTVTGNSAVKPGPDGWDADCYSRDSYSGGAFVSAVVAQTNKPIMFGLNTDPTFDLSYGSIDYALYPYLDGVLYAYESGVQSPVLGTYAAGDVLAVTYDGTAVRYLRNGAVLRTVPVAISLPLYFDSAFFAADARLNGIRFGPMTSNAWPALGGPGKPPDTTNYDFVQGTDGWAGLSSVVAAGSASGGKAALVNGSAQTLVFSTRPQPIQAGRTYKVRARVTRDTGAGGTLYVGVLCYDASGALLTNVGGSSYPYCAAAAASVAVNSQWHDFEGLITGQQAIPTASPNPTQFFAGTVTAVPMLFTYSGWTGDLGVDYLELVDVTEAAVAAAAAGAAQGTANTASTNASSALGLLGDIASDAKLTPGEKQHVKREWDVAVAEKTGIDAQADAYTITTEKTDYGDAYATLSTYITPLLADLATTSDITGATFRSNFAALYGTRQTLLNKIAAEAGKRATWAGVTGVSLTTSQMAAAAATEIVPFFDAAGVSVSNLG